MESRHCKKCPVRIGFMPNEVGKQIPLDLQAPVYEVVTDFTGKKIAKLVEGYYVSHFSTCRHADDFSGKKR